MTNFTSASSSSALLNSKLNQLPFSIAVKAIDAVNEITKGGYAVGEITELRSGLTVEFSINEKHMTSLKLEIIVKDFYSRGTAIKEEGALSLSTPVYNGNKKASHKGGSASHKPFISKIAPMIAFMKASV